MTSASSTKKVLIQIETVSKQEENLQMQRKSLKILQGVTTDKENLTDSSKADKLSRLKALADPETPRERKIETKAVETQTSPDGKQVDKDAQNKEITEKDLTSESDVGEYYWERLAEKRREALNEALDENQRLHERVEGLEEELKNMQQQMEEVQHVVAVLTEMLNENEAEQEVGEEKSELVPDKTINKADKEESAAVSLNDDETNSSTTAED